MQESKPTYQPSFGLVYGYLKGIDRMSSVANELGLINRFSLSLDSYNPEINSMYFDPNMFCILLKCILDNVEIDKIEIIYENDFKNTHLNLETLCKEIISMTTYNANGDDILHIDQIYIYHKDRVHIYIEWEFGYIANGGPMPYHDTFNYAFYIKQQLDRKTKDAIMKCSLENNLDLRSIYIGENTTKQIVGRNGKISFWTRWKR